MEAAPRSLRLGLEAMFVGLDVDLKDFEKLLSVVSEDMKISSEIQQAFLLAVEQAGIVLEKVEENV